MEGAEEIRQSGLPSQLAQSACLRSDGAKAWPKRAQERRCKHASVVHAKMNLSKRLRRPKRGRGTRARSRWTERGKHSFLRGTWPKA